MNLRRALERQTSSFALGCLLLFSIGSLAGCSTVDETAEAQRQELFVLQATLAEQQVGRNLKVYVAPVQAASTLREDFYVEESPKHYGMALERSQLADEIAFVCSGIFGRTKVHARSETLDEARASAFKEGFDVLLVPTVKKWDAVFVDTNGWWWPNALFLYWYFYFPALWIGDEVYGVQATVDYTLESVRNEQSLPGLQNAIEVDSTKVAERVGESVPLGPRVAMDDRDRGPDVFGTYRSGKLDADQWAKNVQPKLEPCARRAVALALGQDLAEKLTRFKNLDEDRRASATAAVHGVVIGVGEYGSSDSCPYADKDALVFASWLTGKPAPDAAPIGTGTLQGFNTPAKLVRTLTNGRATLEDVEKRLGEWKEGTRPEDTVTFYFAGRGVRLAGEGLQGLGLALYGQSRNDPAGAESKTVLSLERLRVLLAQVPARRKLVFLDAGFGGGLRGADRSAVAPLTAEGLRRALPALTGPTGAVVVASASDEPAQVLEVAKHGLLTYSLLDGLLGAADKDSSGQVSWSELEEHTARSVSTLSALDLGASQHPFFFAGDPGRSVLER